MIVAGRRMRLAASFTRGCLEGLEEAPGADSRG